jgi:hypothetical protein
MSERQATIEAAGMRASITRLAQFRPFGAGRIQIKTMLRNLVLTAAYETETTGIGSLAAFRDACTTLWGVETEIDELREVTKELCNEGRLHKHQGVFHLTDEARAELRDRITGSDQTEGEAFADWEVAVRAAAPWIGQDDLDLLRQDLNTWLQSIILEHNIEAAMLLYPEDERGARVLAEVEEHGLSFLPERNQRLQDLRPQALYLFVHQPTPSQRAYLANLMTTAYMVASFTLDPRAAEHLQDLTKGQKIYLDTNIVYAALNLQGPRAYLSASRILKLTADLGYELAVTRWTVEEMKHSLRDGRAKLAKLPLPPRALAEVAANATGEESFITAYWRKYKETGVTVEDFSAMYTELDALIERLGIVITDQSCLAVDRSEQGIADQLSLIARAPGGQFKADPVMLHDVKHRLLIERLRGDGNRSFANAGYWFLTRDSVLIPYGRMELAHTDTLPFAVSIVAWAQIVRSFTPRTQDYDRTLVDLLDTPSIRPKGMVPYSVVADVLGRVDHMVSDSSEEIASRLLLDQAAMADIDQASPADRENVIEDQITAKTNEMQRQLAEAETARMEERAARIAAERDRESIQSQLEDQQRVVAGLSEQVSAESAGRQKAEQVAADSGTQAEHATAEIANTQKTHGEEIKALQETIARQSERARAIGRYATGLGLVVVALAGAIVPLVTGWVAGGWGWVAVIVVAGLVAYAGLRLIIGGKAAAIASLVLAIVTFAIDLHSIAPSGRHTTSKPHTTTSK